MASGCRRWTVFLSRNWISGICRIHQRPLATPIYTQSAGNLNRVPLLSRIPPTSFQQYSTKVIDPADEEVEEPPGILKRFWRWLHSDDSELEYHMSEEENREREEVMVKLQDMYFANPPIQPDLEFYKEVLQILVKYNDKLGVDALWNLMGEMKVEPDEELTALVVPFLEKCREEDS